MLEAANRRVSTHGVNARPSRGTVGGGANQSPHRPGGSIEVCEGERMDIISAYREVGSYRGAAVVCGTTAKTMKRVIARHEAGDAVPVRAPRARNYDQVGE